MEPAGISAGADHPRIEFFGCFEEWLFQLMVIGFVHLPVVAAVILLLHLLVVKADAAVGGGIAGNVTAVYEIRYPTIGSLVHMEPESVMHRIAAVDFLDGVHVRRMPAVDRVDPEFAVRNPVPIDADRHRV